MRLESLTLPDDIVQLKLVGRLDRAGADQISGFFSLATARRGKFIVDLSGVSFLTSMGIRLLMTCAKAQMNHGGELILAAPHPQIREIIEASGIDQFVKLTTDVESAIANLSGAV